MEQAEIEESVKELETRVDRLRSLYEQYFMGIEKIEPNVPRKDVERRFQALRREQIRNTALRFRFHMVLQRYNTYQAYWMRICRQIEEGTYKRDLRAKVRGVEEGAGAPRRRRRRGAPEADEAASVDAIEEGADVDVSFSVHPATIPAPAPPLAIPKAPPLPGAAAAKPPPPALLQEKMRQLAAQIAKKPPVPGTPPPVPPPRAPVATPPSGPAARPAVAAPKITEQSATASLRATPPSVPPPPPARPAARPAPRPRPPPPPAPKPERAPGDLPEERVRQLYAQFVETKRKQQESTAAVTFDGLAKTLRESSEKLKAKHTGKSVDFEVTVKDGKTILRPIVK